MTFARLPNTCTSAFGVHLSFSTSDRDCFRLFENSSAQCSIQSGHFQKHFEVPTQRQTLSMEGETRISTSFARGWKKVEIKNCSTQSMRPRMIYNKKKRRSSLVAMSVEGGDKKIVLMTLIFSSTNF